MDSNYSQLTNTWIEIDRQVIRSNIQKLGGIAQKRGQDFMLMVKANAYGHGLLEMSLLAQQEKVAFLGVTELGEAALLRDNGIKIPILLFGEPLPEYIPLLLSYSITPVVSSLEFLEELVKHLPRKADEPFAIHIKINTGLNRFGLLPNQLDDLRKILNKHPALRMEGILTHYSAADHDPTTTKRQLQTFIQCVDECRQAGMQIPYIHASNSAGTAWLDESRTNLVRLGLSAYGLQPSNERKIDVVQGFTWKARLMAIMPVQKGEGIGYGGTWKAKRDSKIGVIGVGYYDGFRRSPSNFGYVLCRGRKMPVVGNVMMNHALIDLTDAPADVEVNEDIVLVGMQNDKRITFEEIGMQVGTINEEIVTAIRSTIPRAYNK